jgi:AAA ATPase domain
MSVMASPDPPVVLVGREEPMRRLRAALDDARSGSSSTIVILGPPGVGKTALVAQLRSQAADCSVVHARGIETESEWSYAALHQLLMPILQLSDKIPSATQAAIEMAIGGAPGAPEPMMVGMGVLGLLSEASEEKPVLCVLDDVHWMDIASQRAIRFATRRLNAERVLVITTQRSDDRDRAGWLHSDSERVELLPLDLAFETELLTRLAGGPVPNEVAVRVHQVTGGVPLGTREVARLLTDSQLTGREHLPDRLPISGSIHRLFDQSLELLSRRVLLLAAADDSGAAGPVASAARSIGLSNDDLDALEGLGWVSFADGQLEFRHPLVRSVVYDSALIGERREAHRHYQRRTPPRATTSVVPGIVPWRRHRRINKPRTTSRTQRRPPMLVTPMPSPPPRINWPRPSVSLDVANRKCLRMRLWRPGRLVNLTTLSHSLTALSRWLGVR